MTLNPPPKYFRLKPDGEVRLMGAYIVRCGDIITDEGGKITEVHVTADLVSKNGNPSDGRKIKGTIHWLSAPHAADADVMLYDRLFTKENMNEVESSQYADFINPDSVKRLTGCKLEESLKNAVPGERFQFVRLGYFTPDSKNPGVFLRSVTLKDSYKI